MATFFADFAAAAAVDIDGINDTTGARSYARKPYPRVLTKAGYTGSAAAGDSVVAVMVEDTEVARLVNTKTGKAPDNDDMVTINVPVPANALLRCLLKTTPTTNAARAVFNTVP